MGGSFVWGYVGVFISNVLCGVRLVFRFDVYCKIGEWILVCEEVVCVWWIGCIGLLLLGLLFVRLVMDGMILVGNRGVLFEFLWFRDGSCIVKWLGCEG